MTTKQLDLLLPQVKKIGNELYDGSGRFVAELEPIMSPDDEDDAEVEHDGPEEPDDFSGAGGTGHANDESRDR